MVVPWVNRYNRYNHRRYTHETGPVKENLNRDRV